MLKLLQTLVVFQTNLSLLCFLQIDIDIKTFYLLRPLIDRASGVYYLPFSGVSTYFVCRYSILHIILAAVSGVENTFILSTVLLENSELKCLFFIASLKVNASFKDMTKAFPRSKTVILFTFYISDKYFRILKTYNI